MTARLFLEAALRRWVKQPAEVRDRWVLRGSMATGEWVGRQRRNCEDLDFVAMGDFDFAATVDQWRRALKNDCGDGVRFDGRTLQAETIFADTPFPGVRLNVAAYRESEPFALQIDVGFGDPLPLKPAPLTIRPADGPPLTILSIRPEVGFAWKLHGMVEKEGYSWRGKDLADLWLMDRYVEMDETALREAIRVAFESRDGPLWRLDRLVLQQMGGSPSSRKQWRKFREQHPESGAPEDLQQVIAAIARRTRPHWEALREAPPLYPVAPRREEMLQAIADDPDFATFPWEQSGASFAYLRLTRTAFPATAAAFTHAEFRRRQLRREARGITFDASGRLIARPYPKFDRLDENELDALRGAEAFEKLDGSLVFPTPFGDSFVLRTRRGRSEIADQAFAFAQQSASDYEGLIETCLQRRWTPVFEWCSRKRPIVFDHPVDRLVLTGIRENLSGELLPRETYEPLAAECAVETAEYLGRIDDPETWLDEVRGWLDREGVVARTTDGRLMKIKSERYLWLHRAVEGPHKDAARWRLILEGAAEQLCEVSRLRGLELADYVAETEAAIARQAARVVEQFNELPDRGAASRKLLAERLQSVPAWRRRLYFTAFETEDFVGELREIVREACPRNAYFLRLIQWLEGPRRKDG